ncbi:MAG: carboxy terminal-processing peptidase [Elusimicrobiota bacterium]
MTLPRVRIAVALVVACAWPARAAALKPAPDAAVISQMVAHMLEQDHYVRKPIDESVSPDLLKLYLDDYDPNRMFFERADIDDFKRQFGKDMAPRVKNGDVEPAYVIFNRFMERLKDRVRLVHEILGPKSGAEEPPAAARAIAQSSATAVPVAPFDFNEKESVLLDRRKAPWPEDDARARDIWRKRIKNDVLEEMLDKVKPQDQVKNVLKRYDRLLANYKEFDANDVLQNYLTALANTYDPHSDYMAAPEEDNFDISMSLSLVGIGAVLSSDGEYAKIVSLVPGGPADKSKKIHPNDHIEAVAQGADGPFADAGGMKLDKLVEIIRGKKGTTVRLRLIPADAIDPSARLTVSLVREEIKLKDQEAKAEVISWPVARGKKELLGAIRLPSFYADMRQSGRESATRDVSRLVAYLNKKGVSGIILDLRDNGGGSLAEAVAMAGLFIGPNPVVQVRDSRGRVEILRAPESSPEYSGPLVVLTSRASASASEIVTAAMQDYRRAPVIGEKSTFGKGTVQSVLELSDYMPWSLRQDKPGALKITIQKFYRVSGGSTQNRGVIPDIRLPSLDDDLDMTESSLPNALPYDQIDPAPYRPVDDVGPRRLRNLDEASQLRVAVSTDFAYVREDISRYLRQKKDKRVSLNYDERLARRRADEAIDLSRKKERAARKNPPFSVVDVSVEDLVAGIDPLSPSSAAVVSASISSETAASAASVSSSSAAAEDYAHAPPPEDFVLKEAAHVLADLAAGAPLPKTVRAKKKRSRWFDSP